MHRAHSAYSVCLSPARQPKLSQWLAQKTADKTKVSIFFTHKTHDTVKKKKCVKAKLSSTLGSLFWRQNFKMNLYSGINYKINVSFVSSLRLKCLWTYSL